jgi:AsmA protein
LSQRNSAKEFASINNARLYIAWWPLFKKQLVLERVEIDGMHANVARLKDGTTNYDDLLIRDETLSPVTFDIDGVRITNSAINWQDEVKWKRVALQDLHIETGRLADMVPGNLTASFHLNSEKLHSDSNVELKSRLLYDLKAKRYEFADIEGKLAGTVAGFSNLALRFNGNLENNPGQDSLLAENVVVSGTGNYGQRSIEARLALPRLQLAKGILSGNQLTINATMSQFDDKWTTAVQMPAFELANQIFNAAELSADFDFKGEGRTLQGKLSFPVNVDLTATPKLQLSAIALNFSATHPVLAGELIATATGSMNADFSERNANLNLKAKIDDNEIAGKLAIKDFSHPEYTFELNANRLDLDRYISADWIKRYQNDAMQLDFSGIRKLVLNGRLRANEFKAAKLKSTRLAADIKIEQDTLKIAPLSAKLYGGALTGSLSVAAQATPQIALKQNLKGIQLNALLADTAGTGKLAGKGDVALELSAEGGSIGALRKTLNGSVSLVLARGSLAGIDLRTALLEGKDDLGAKSEVHVHEARFSERTEFSELKAAFNILEGSSHGNSFDMRSPLFHIAGEGDLALDSGSISYRLAATVGSTLKRKTAGELAELKGVTVPIRVSGPHATPSIALDFAAASGDLVTKRIAAKAAAEQAAAKTADQAAAAAAKRTAPLKKRAAKANKK